MLFQGTMQWEYVTICCGLLCLASASGLCWQYKEWRVATHSQHLTSHLSSYDQCKIYSKVTLGQVARSDELAISAEKNGIATSEQLIANFRPFIRSMESTKLMTRSCHVSDTRSA